MAAPRRPGERPGTTEFPGRLCLGPRREAPLPLAFPPFLPFAACASFVFVVTFGQEADLAAVKAAAFSLSLGLVKAARHLSPRRPADDLRPHSKGTNASHEEMGGLAPVRATPRLFPKQTVLSGVGQTHAPAWSAAPTRRPGRGVAVVWAVAGADGERSGRKEAAF